MEHEDTHVEDGTSTVRSLDVAPCAITFGRHCGYIEADCRQLWESGDHCTTCVTLVELGCPQQNPADLETGAFLAAHFHTRQGSPVVATLIKFCVDVANYVVTQPPRTSQRQRPPGASFGYVYFRNCDGFYRNALQETFRVKSATITGVIASRFLSALHAMKDETAPASLSLDLNAANSSSSASPKIEALIRPAVDAASRTWDFSKGPLKDGSKTTKLEPSVRRKGEIIAAAVLQSARNRRNITKSVPGGRQDAETRAVAAPPSVIYPLCGASPFKCLSYDAEADDGSFDSRKFLKPLEVTEESRAAFLDHRRKETEAQKSMQKQAAKDLKERIAAINSKEVSNINDADDPWHLESRSTRAAQEAGSATAIHDNTDDDPAALTARLHPFGTSTLSYESRSFGHRKLRAELGRVMPVTSTKLSNSTSSPQSSPPQPPSPSRSAPQPPSTPRSITLPNLAPPDKYKTDKKNSKRCGCAIGFACRNSCIKRQQAKARGRVEELASDLMKMDLQ